MSLLLQPFGANVDLSGSRAQRDREKMRKRERNMAREMSACALYIPEIRLD